MIVLCLIASQYNWGMIIQFDPDLAVAARFLTLNLVLSIRELLLVFALAAR